MSAASEATARACEAASIATTLMVSGTGTLADGVMLVYRDVIEGIRVPTIDQSDCPAPACPTVGRAVDVAMGAMQEATGRIATELLTGLMAALRRLAELEEVSISEAVRRLTAQMVEGS